MAPTTQFEEICSKLIDANHILHYHGAVDGFGHISVRHPGNPAIYIMCGYMPPAAVETVDDLIQYYVDGSHPVDPNAKKGYSERFIHGELFKRFPEIQAVVHSHAEAVSPYVVGSVPLKPIIHMTGFIGRENAKMWDIAPLYSDEDQQDMLVNSPRLGASLAEEFASSKGSELEETVVLMKRHGYTTVGPDIETAVYRAIYMIVNADVQTKATLLSASIGSAPIASLSLRETRDCRKMTEATQDKAWRLWVREVGTIPLYVNALKARPQ